MAEVSQNTKYVKLDDGVSFELVRTNPKLTTNTKLMYNGKKMYMESYASCELLNRTVYKNVSVKQNSTYNKDIAKFLRGTGSQAYSVYQNFSNVTISDSYDNQFENLYWCGAEYIDSSFYDEEIGFVAPLYLREKLPNYFLIFKLDTPSNYNLNKDKDGNILDSNFDFKTDILDKAVLIKSFDLREGSVLGNYIRNYVEQDSFEFDKSMYVNFSNGEITYYGINRNSGILEKKVENFENELLKNDNPILKNDKWFTEGFERNGLIFPYIMNIEYLFDDETFKNGDGETYDFARYIGLYCNNIEFGEFLDLKELEKSGNTQDNAIYYFEDNKKNLHRYVNDKSGLKIDGKDSNFFDKNLISGYEHEKITAYAEPLDINEGYINRAQYGFKIVKPLEPGDWIGIELNGNIECYFADNKNVDSYMPIGGYSDFRFSVNENSSLSDIADALVKSVNRNKKSKFEAKCYDNIVVFCCKLDGNEYNGSETGGSKILMEASLLYNEKISLLTSNTVKYNDSDSDLNELFGNYYIDYFYGSCELDIDQNEYVYKNIFKIYTEESDFFSIGRYLKTNNGNGRKIIANMIYINAEDEIIPEYRIILVDNNNIPKNQGYDISISSTYQVEIMDIFKPNHGVFSWFPVKDFDFDINYSTYGLNEAFVNECNKLSKKINYTEETQIDIDLNYKNTQKNISNEIKELAKSPFVDSNGDSIEKEYDYYFEQFHPDLCLMSKTVPYISKWGYYDEQKDSCENPYRLNVSKIFGISNLSANTYLISCDEKEYTHSMPYYMTMNTPDYYKDYQYIETDEEYKNHYDNGNSELDTISDCINHWIELFKRTDEDMFSYFFSGKKYGKRFDKKYSRLMNGDKFHNSSTLFRGVKFEVVRQYNGIEKRSSEYNGYKFSFIYIPIVINNITFNSKVHFVKNDTFKFIVGIVFVNTLLGVYEHNIFNGSVDYFNKAFLYSACKDIIRAENINNDFTLDFVLKCDDKSLTLQNISNDILEKIYDVSKEVNIFYIWRENDIDNKIIGDIFFVTKTTDIKDASDIICYVEGEKIDFKTGTKNNNNTVDFVKNIDGLGYKFTSVSIEKNDEVTVFWEQNNEEEYGIKIYGYKKLKRCGDIKCDMIPPYILYKDIVLSDICDINSIYNLKEYEIDITTLNLKQGPLQNVLVNLGIDSILGLRFYSIEDGVDLYIADDRKYNLNLNKYYNCVINFNVENSVIDILLDEKNINKIFVSNIENLKIDIYIKDALDVDYNSLGLKEYFSSFDQISMYNITQYINNDYNVNYYSTVEDNKYKIRVIEPDSIEIEDVYEAYPVTISQNNVNIVGSIDIKEKMDIDKIGKMVINRYSGFYNPIFTDILYYDDYVYNKCELLYSNTNIDYNYNDGYGEFGIIKNMYYHKTNISQSDKILTLENPVYPAINEYALDCREYNIFSSNWDTGYFMLQNDLDNSSICSSIGSMKDGLCMFGSKYLNLPDNIFIDTFKDGELWDGKMVIDSRDNTDTEIMYKEINDRYVRYYLFIEKRLKRYLKEKLSGVFEKYINVEYSFGNNGTIEDDIDEYIEKNILKLYKLDKVYMYIKSERMGRNDRLIENEYSKYLNETNESKIEYGFPVKNVDGETVLKSSSFIMTKINEFDRQIIYNLKPGYKESFGFSISIKRK